MCIQSRIQDTIADLTNNGEHIAYFLVDAMAGAADPATKICHRIDAAKLLTKYGIPQHDHAQTADHQAATEAAQCERDAQTDEPTTHKTTNDAQADQPADSDSVAPAQKPPTLHDIVAYPVARHIRNRTENGETLIQTLVHIMRGGTPKLDFFTGEYTHAVKPHHRISAAKELLQRAFGETTTRRSVHIDDNLTQFAQKLANGQLDDHARMDMDKPFSEHDPINSRLAKLTRDHTKNGIEAADFLISVIDEGEEDGWQPAHQLAAAKELLHRAYDLNYDAVTHDHIDAYNTIAYPEPIHEAAHKLERRRRMQELIDAYDKAHASGNRQAADAAERAYHHYLKYGDNPNPDDPPADHQPAPKRAAVINNRSP